MIKYFSIIAVFVIAFIAAFSNCNANCNCQNCNCCNCECSDVNCVCECPNVAVENPVPMAEEANNI